MSRLYVIYGSEASILTSFINNVEDAILRIYNQNKPVPRANCIDVLINDFEKIFQKHCESEKVQEIVFIGAAFNTQTSLMINESKENIQRQLTTNITNYVMLARVLLPTMIKKRFGRYIYLSSFRSEVISRGTSIYSASKSFGETFFKGLGVENGAFGISSTSIQMGYFDGKMLENFTTEQIGEIKRSIGCRRLGSPEDLEATIHFCIKNPYLNGGVIGLNGGISHG
jgi:NAD(P)-dependent dehydrogenase (short-subunit alcohol dehydrogenase family)